MSNILQEICEKKQADVDLRKAERSLDVLKTEATQFTLPEGVFLSALQTKADAGQPALIAEIKKASPSQGLIRADFNPEAIATAYIAGGAVCFSILTEERYFQGSDQYLQDVRNMCNTPILRKDFTVDAYQIYEAKTLGAHCILLIMAVLSDDKAIHFHELAYELGLDVLVEVHDEGELERALAIPDVRIIGVNNRNLKTMTVDLQTSFNMVKLIPEHIFRVSESGISQAEHVETLMNSGFQGFLIGEHFMRQDDIEQAVCSLIDL